MRPPNKRQGAPEPLGASSPRPKPNRPPQRAAELRQVDLEDWLASNPDWRPGDTIRGELVAV